MTQPNAPCLTCSYVKAGKGFVMGEGPTNASLMIVGEAPGNSELLEGRPFVGPAGVELNRWLTITGIQRSKCYVTNVVKCLPNTKTPGQHQCKMCATRYLFSEIKKVNPKYILLLGHTAAQFFNVPKARKMGYADGYIIPWGSDHLVMSTWHPAYCLRERFVPDAGFASAMAIADIHKLKITMEGKWAREEIGPELVDPEEAISAIHLGYPTAIDIETAGLSRHGNTIARIGFAWRDPFTDQLKKTSRAFDIVNDAQLLIQPGLKIFANINFDVGVLYHSGHIWVEGPFYDTQLGTSLLQSDLPKGLESAARRYLNITPWKWMQNEDGDEALYNAMDCAVTYRLWEEYETEGGDVDKEGLRSTFERAMKVLPLTVDAQRTGVRVDEQMMMNLRHLLSAKMEKLEEQLDHEAHKIGMIMVNWNSPQQKQEILYTKLKLPKQFTTDVKTKKRRLTCDADALEILQHHHPIPRLLRSWQVFNKLVSTYLKVEDVVNGRLYPEFLLDVTGTGRMSSRHPNFQNQPRTGPIRKIYLPDQEDHYFLEADFSQIEMRVMAFLSQDPGLVQAYERGWDVHTFTAQQVFNKEDISKSERHMAKYVNYGIPYGREAKSLSEQYGWPLQDAKDFMATHRSKFPVLWAWLEGAYKEARERRYLTNPYGRRRYFYGVNFRNQAYNFPAQSTAADILYEAIIRFADALPGIRQMLWVHDSFGFSVPKNQMQDVIVAIKELTSECMLGFPTPVDISYGPRWKEWVEEG